MHISSASHSPPCITVNWDDGSKTRFPAIFLRDNDPDELHPQTHERIFDLTSVPFELSPLEIRLDENTLVVNWSDKPTDSRYPAEWLFQHRPGKNIPDGSEIKKTSWNNSFTSNVPRFEASTCKNQPKTMVDLLGALKEHGLVVVTGFEDDPDAGTRFGELIGFKRDNNFGAIFHVVNMPDPNNLAYTSIQLPLHTDLSNQELIPGYQFFHCYKNEAKGGNSTYADGFRISEDLREEEPELFRILCSTQVPFRFHDDNYDIRCKHPIIREDKNGNIVEFIFNAHLADTPDMPEAEMLAFYQAYQELMRRIRSDRYQIEIRLQAGEMAILDNRRVLHGRSEFDPTTGHRQLQGYYIDYGELDSKMRLLSGQSS